MNSPKVKQAIKKVFHKLSLLSKEEFNELINKHKDGDIAQSLEYSGHFKIYDMIPKGIYCDKCPFHSIRKNLPEQENGYCSFLQKSDWDLNEERGNIEWNDGTITQPHDFPMSLLWDGCKECDINEEFEDKEEDFIQESIDIDNMLDNAGYFNTNELIISINNNLNVAKEVLYDIKNMSIEEYNKLYEESLSY